MLLLMIEAELHQSKPSFTKTRDGLRDRPIHMVAVGKDLVERRPADHAASGPGMPFTFALIIAVEEDRQALAVKTIAGAMIAQDECIQEPARTRNMPFGGRGVRLRLESGVGICQRGGACQASGQDGEAGASK